MALVINTDTYISRGDADIYVTGNYASTDSKRIAWDATLSADKDVLLRKAAKIIDRQPLRGFKNKVTQTMAFPRTVYTMAEQTARQVVNFDENWYIQAETPNGVIHAQVEIALDLTDSSGSKRIEMQRQGVTSFTLGDLSESYSGRQNRITSQEAKELLGPYLAGSVRIV